MKIHKLLVLVALIIASFLFVGCSPDAPKTHASPAQSPPLAETACSPAKIAIMIDSTGSRLRTRTPTATEEDFEPYYDVLKKCGGELAVGLITDDSNQGLLRVRIDVPPTKPAPPANEANPFALAVKAGEYEKVKQNYDGQLVVWREAMDKRFLNFKKELKTLLSASPCARKTDIWGAVARMDIFLAEDDSSWNATTKKYGVLVSDCDDNVRKNAVAPKSDATWLIVNGTPVSQLTALSPMHFESLDSAARHISAKSGGLNHGDREF